MEEILYFIITIGILVFVHEFGHFAAAKMSGMRVDAFAIGFGYRLFGYNKKTGFSFGRLEKDFDCEGKTDYRLCLLPLGGYVKIAGMVDESMDTEFAKEPPKDYEFRAKSTPKKIFVITAGVLMNLLLAVLIFWGINFFHGKNFSKTTTIAQVDQNSPADSAGFKSGDKILSINGVEINYWEEVRTSIFINELGKDLDVVVSRDGNNVELNIPRKIIPRDESTGLFLVAAGLKPAIADVLQNSPADSAGIKPGDIFLTINGTELNSIPQTQAIITSKKLDTISLAYLRGVDTIQTVAVPNKDGKIGIALGGYAFLGETEKITYGFFASFSMAGSDIVRMTQLTFLMLGKVISGDIQFGQAFGGPIKIAQFAARSADSGIMSFLMFLALLSLSLAIINILPFPVLDGGHLIIIIIEGIAKREIPIKIKIAIQNFGVVLLLLLMAFIIYNDIIGLK